jgi:hypothetical protein
VTLEGRVVERDLVAVVAAAVAVQLRKFCQHHKTQIDNEYQLPIRARSSVGVVPLVNSAQKRGPY